MKIEGSGFPAGRRARVLSRTAPRTLPSGPVEGEGFIMSSWTWCVVKGLGVQGLVEMGFGLRVSSRTAPRTLLSAPVEGSGFIRSSFYMYI